MSESHSGTGSSIGGVLLAMFMVVFAMRAGSSAAQDPTPGSSSNSLDLADRIEGLLIGSAIGDAAGGPVEFQPPDRGLWIDREMPLDSASVQTLARRFRLRAYQQVNRAAPYGPWQDDAPAGTVTDDTRFKILFMRSMDVSEPPLPSAEAFARELLDWHGQENGVYGDLPGQWLDEFALSARWVLGDRDVQTALPPERQWGGIPTMAGQMPFLPISALHPGEPEAAYLSTWSVDFLDTGWGRDMTAALVAGLSTALTPGAEWSAVENAMRATDPFGFGRVPWVERRVIRWLDTARAIAHRAEGRPARLYDLLESELGAETWWEAHVPIVIVFAAAETAAYDPLATMQLILEFGHDTDSALQVAGALIGAMHGPEVFPDDMRTAVEARLEQDFGESVSGWTDHLCRCRN